MPKIAPSNLERIKDEIIVKYPYVYTEMQKKKLTDHKSREYIISRSKLDIPKKSGLNIDYPLVVMDSGVFERFLKYVCQLEDEDVELVAEAFGYREMKKEHDIEMKKELKRIEEQEKEMGY